MRKVLKKFLAVLLSVAILLLSGCVSSSKKDGDGTVIAVSFYPVYIFTLNLVDGIEDVRVERMAEQNTGCLHDYTLTARDARLLSDADVFVINGAGMETFLQDIDETVENISIIDSSVGIELLCEENHHHEESEHSHNHGENAHIWMSVKNAKKQILNIKNGLLENLPQYESEINDNYKVYLEKLNVLEKEMQENRESLKNKNVITFHGAYEYLAEDMGFNISATIESDEGGEPSAKKLAVLCGEIVGNDVKALFVEPDYNGSSAQIISNETGVKIYVLNPVISGENVLTAYEDTMMNNIEIIKKAVS